MKALEGAFNWERVLVGTFSVIAKLMHFLAKGGKYYICMEGGGDLWVRGSYELLGQQSSRQSGGGGCGAS